MAYRQDSVPGNLQTTGSITLTNAQIKSLRSSPVTIVSAPAAGKIIAPLHLTYKFNYGGNNVFVTGGNLELRATGTAGLLLNATSPILYTGSVDKLYATGATQAAALLTLEAQPIVITTSSSDPTGNAANDNTITYQFFYFVLTL